MIAGLETLLPVLAAFIVITVAPGPANIAVATISMAQGRKAGLLFGTGLGVGFAFWGILAATGLGALLQASAEAMIVLKLVGGVYLLWLAWVSWRSADNNKPEARTDQKKRGFLQGLFLNLSNPKAIVAWLAALAAGFGDSGQLAQLLSVMFICIALGFLNYFAYALIFSLGGFMALYRRFARWVNRTVAVFFAATGFAIIRSAFQRTA
ncbi:MAG: LysE family translocator [Pseudomonadota bacterium]